MAVFVRFNPFGAKRCYAWRGCFNGNLFISFLFGLLNLFRPLWNTASAICLSPCWESNTLCVNMGVTYPYYPNATGGLQDFREKVNGPTASVWAQVGEEPLRFHWLDVGVIRRASKFGTSFEARRDAAAPAGTFGLFHLCRRGPCGFLGCSRIANGMVSDGKKATLVHVARVAYAGVNESPGPAPVPIVAPIGVNPVADAVWWTWKVGLASLALVGGCLRV